MGEHNRNWLHRRIDRWLRITASRGTTITRIGLPALGLVVVGILLERFFNLTCYIF